MGSPEKQSRPFDQIKAERKRKIEEANQRNRRRIIGGIAGGVLAITIPGAAAVIYSSRGRDEATDLSQPQILTDNYKDLQFVYPDRRETADVEYLKELTAKLSAEKGTKESRTKAVVDSLYNIYTEGLGLATALQIDTSGIFLTAGHVFGSYGGNAVTPEQKQALMINYKTKIARPVHWYILDPFQDLAIFYSPTGKEKGPVSNLQIRQDIPAEGSGVVAYGTHVLNANSTKLEIKSYQGTVAPSLPEYGEPPYTETFVMKGAMIVPGDSGGAVRDEQGRVVGFASSNVPYPLESKWQDGGAASSIKGINTLIANGEKRQIVYLPVSK